MRFTSTQENSQCFNLGRPLLAGLALAVAVSSFGCGKNNKADGASFTTLPESPIVITADTKDMNGNKIKAPWFSFRVNSTNGTDSIYTILALTATVMGIDKSGNLKSTDLGWVPSDYTVILPIGMNGYVCSFTHFGEWNPGDTKFLMLDGDSTVYRDPTDPNNQAKWIPCKRVPIFVVGDNPSGPAGKTFIYNVRAKPLGWFGDYSNPSDRFETKFKFKTQ